MKEGKPFSARKYVVFPGYIISKTDGDRHYINATNLMSLYRVNQSECFVYEPAPWWTSSIFRYNKELCKGKIGLYPRFHGDYDLENCVRED